MNLTPAKWFIPTRYDMRLTPYIDCPWQKAVFNTKNTQTAAECPERTESLKSGGGPSFGQRQQYWRPEDLPCMRCVNNIQNLSVFFVTQRDFLRKAKKYLYIVDNIIYNMVSNLLRSTHHSRETASGSRNPFWDLLSKVLRNWWKLKVRENTINNLTSIGGNYND